MSLKFNNLESTQQVETGVDSSGLKDQNKFPDGFENWPKEKQRDYILNNGSSERVLEENGVSFYETQRGLNSRDIALSATRKLERYIGDRPNFRSESFSKLEQSEKDKVYMSITSAVNGSINHLDWLDGKLITLVGEPGISYENGELKVGPGVSKEEILNYIGNLAEMEKSNETENSKNINKSNDLSEDEAVSVETVKPEDRGHNQEGYNFKEGDLVSWNYDGNTGQGRIISFGVEDADPKVIVDVGSDGTLEISVNKLSSVEEGVKDGLTENGVVNQNNEAVPSGSVAPEYTEEFKKYLEKQEDVVEEGGINSDSDREIEKQNHQNSIPPESDFVQDDLHRPISKDSRKESNEVVKPVFENQNELNPNIPKSELTPENNFTNKDLIKKDNQVESLSGEIIVGNKESDVYENEKVVKGEVILPQELEKASNIEKSNVFDTEASEVVDSQKIDTQGINEEEKEKFDIDKVLDISEIKESEEWKNFERMREDVARNDALNKDASVTGLGVELNRSDYYGYKDVLANKIREKILQNAGKNLTDDERFLLKAKTNELIFDLLLKEENEIYNNTLSEHRNESILDKGKGQINKLFGSKAFEWYRSQSMGKKILISTALFAPIATIGAFATGAGASVAIGATAYRGARVGFGMAGAKLGSAIAGRGLEFGGNKLLWSEDEINKYEREKFTEIMNSEEDFETKSRKYDEVTQEVKKRRMDLAKAKAGLAVAGGVGAGIASGEAMEGILGSKVENVFNNESLLTPVAKPGDSIWKMLENTLDHNDRFKNLTEAQKTYVVSFYTDKILDNPSGYGLKNPNNLMVGDRLDFKDLFSDKKGFDTFIDKVEKDISPGSTRANSILENNIKIKNWVKMNPNTPLTNEKVADMLSSPTKEISIEDTGKPLNYNRADSINVEDKGEVVEPIRSAMPRSLDGIDIETVRSEMPDKLDENISSTQGINEKIVPNSMEYIQNQKIADQFEYNDINKKINNNIPGEVEENILGETEKNNTQLPQSIDEVSSSLQKEIEEAKARLSTLEGGIPKPVNEAVMAEQIQKAFVNEIDGIYGKKGFMGIGKVAGIDTKEWKFISKLPAVKVVEFYSGDSSESNLSPIIARQLAETESHRNLWYQTDGLMKSIDGAVKPYQNETMGDFVKRLGGYVLKNHSSKNI